MKVELNDAKRSSGNGDWCAAARASDRWCTASSSCPAGAIDDRHHSVHRIEFPEDLPRRIDRHMKGILEKRDDLEQTERIDDSAGDQRVIKPKPASGNAGPKSDQQEIQHGLLRSHADDSTR